MLGGPVARGAGLGADLGRSVGRYLVAVRLVTIHTRLLGWQPVPGAVPRWRAARGPRSGRLDRYSQGRDDDRSASPAARARSATCTRSATTILMVASDRISTYDVVHPTPIPDKGKVLTGLSVAWFELTQRSSPTISSPPPSPSPTELRGRALVVRAAGDAPGRVRRPRLPDRLRLEGLPGDGLGLRDRAAARACGSPSASPSRSSRRLRRPSSASTTRTSRSSRRSPRSATSERPSGCATSRSRCTSCAAAHALERGIILADTKFEFGFDASGVLTLGDEALTPDSSRFWPADAYEPGRPQPSFDKQFVRDWASSTGWDRTAAGAADPRGDRRAYEEPLHRGLRADRRPSVRRLARPDRGASRRPRARRTSRRGPGVTGPPTSVPVDPIAS